MTSVMRVAMIIAMLFGLSDGVWALTFTVDSTTDAVDAKPGDGKCATAVGECTLRAAVQEANAHEDVNLINLLAGTYVLKIPPTAGIALADSGDLDLYGDLTINGVEAANTVVDGGGLDRVFSVRPSSTVTISGMTIRNGQALQGEKGGGIWNEGTLTLTDVVVSGNKTRSDETLQAHAPGGGIYSNYALRIRNSTIEGNAAADEGGGIFNDEKGTLTITETTVRKNVSLTDKGGGIANRGHGTVIFGTVAENVADESGGGIENIGTLVLTHGTVSGNEGEVGGGIRNVGTLTITDATISGNTARTSGGGIQNEDTGKAGLNNVTLAGNTSKGAGGGGGIFNKSSATMRMRNSIVAKNTATKSPDCAGTLVSQGYNLIQDVSGCTLSDTLVGNVTGKEPKLGPLADNGGPTQTQTLLPGSPAINAGNPAKPGSGDTACEVSDQRGVARPTDVDGPYCDIGAYQTGGSKKPTQ